MKKLKIFLVCAVISAISIFGLTACFNDGSEQQETGNGTTGSSVNSSESMGGSGTTDSTTGGNGTTASTTAGNIDTTASHEGTDEMGGTDGNILDGVGDVINDGLDEVETVIDDIDGNNAGNSTMR